MLLEAYMYVLINVIFSTDVVLGTLENSFLKQQTDDLVCGNSSTLTDLGTVGNVIACSRICSSRIECRGFYFNESDGACWGSNQTECQTVTQAAFYRKDCGAPPSVQNAVVSGGDTVETTLRTYTCNTGYAVNGTATVTCQAGATWSAVAFSCVPDCGAPPAIPNADVSTGGTLAEDTRTYTCSPGYVLHSVVTLDTTCQPNGSWSSPSFDCLSDCGAPPSVQNAAVSGGDTVEGTIRTYTCDTGYAVNGTATVTCQTGTTWSAVAFSCGPVCPPGWYQIASSCYIVANSPTISVGEIMTFCNNTYPYDSFMVQLETPEENAAVVAFLQNTCHNGECSALEQRSVM